MNERVPARRVGCEGPSTTRPGGSHWPPLTSGSRPIAAVRMLTDEGVKSTLCGHSTPPAATAAECPEGDLRRPGLKLADRVDSGLSAYRRK
jgi:hypothetical protein